MSNRNEGSFDGFLEIVGVLGYVLIVLPVTWLAKKIWRLDA